VAEKPRSKAGLRFQREMPACPRAAIDEREVRITHRVGWPADERAAAHVPDDVVTLS
jgi:hypothetical protein